MRHMPNTNYSKKLGFDVIYKNIDQILPITSKPFKMQSYSPYSSRILQKQPLYIDFHWRIPTLIVIAKHFIRGKNNENSTTHSLPKICKFRRKLKQRVKLLLKDIIWLHYFIRRWIFYISSHCKTPCFSPEIPKEWKKCQVGEKEFARH